MNISVNDEAVINDKLMNILEKAASACVGRDAEISLSFVSAEEIRELNRYYRGMDSVTDVLSFPMYDDNDVFEEELILGDVVICMDRVREQAAELGHSEEREVVYLFTHSVLHLIGYDHISAEDKREMRQREEEVMAELGIGRQ
ncbi:MAG: rRNA maturation RNase YbeY [Lentihominibacter sp.]|jgi:probable rRNA maturation factor